MMHSLLLLLLPLVVMGRTTTLTEENFNDELAKQPALIMFFAEWCGHCKAAKPHWKNLENTFESRDDVLIGAIDADKAKFIGTKYGISGFPTIKFFPGGDAQPIDYSLARDTEALIKFVNDKTGLNERFFLPGIPDHNIPLAKFDDIIADPKHDVLAVVHGSNCHRCPALIADLPAVKKAFIGDNAFQIATILADSDNRIIERYGNELPQMILYTQSNKEGIKYSEPDFSLEAIVGFLNENLETHRTVEGGFTEMAHPTQEIQKLISKFRSAANVDAKKSVIEEVKIAVKSVTGRYVPFVKFYANHMLKFAEDGSNYLKKESARLTKLSKSKISDEARAQMAFRLNFLRQLKGGGEPTVETVHEEL